MVRSVLDTTTPEPDWFAARVVSPSPWEQIEIPEAYWRAALAERLATESMATHDPRLPDHVRRWRARPRALVLPAADWRALTGHELVGWLYDGLEISRRLQRLIADLGPLAEPGTLAIPEAPEYLFTVALYDGARNGGASADDTASVVEQFFYTWTLSPRAYREYARRCDEPERGAAIRAALWLLSPPGSPAQADVAQQLVTRLGDTLDATGLGSLFLALDHRAASTRAWHLLALACDGRFPVLVESVKRDFERAERPLPTSADPAHLAAPIPDESPQYPTVDELLDVLSPARRQLLDALLKTNGNESAAARLLGRSPQAVHQQLARLAAQREALRRALGLDT